MPVLSGGDALAKIRAINPNVPVILSSGFDERETARKYAGLKPQGFLQKPYTSKRLVDAVSNVLNRRET
jgi:DNA-binding NarL/FixJ family response regulator